MGISKNCYLQKVSLDDKNQTRSCQQFKNHVDSQNSIELLNFTPNFAKIFA
jgi:hypothetical protein